MYPKNLYSVIQVWSVSSVIIQFGGICALMSVRLDNFSTQILQKTNKSDYECDMSVSISLKFAFNIFRKVKENIFEPKNA